MVGVLLLADLGEGALEVIDVVGEPGLNFLSEGLSDSALSGNLVVKLNDLLFVVISEPVLD